VRGGCQQRCPTRTTIRRMSCSDGWPQGVRRLWGCPASNSGSKKVAKQHAVTQPGRCVVLCCAGCRQARASDDADEEGLDPEQLAARMRQEGISLELKAPAAAGKSGGRGGASGGRGRGGGRSAGGASGRGGRSGGRGRGRNK
jgi:hypothetical protein